MWEKRYESYYCHGEEKSELFVDSTTQLRVKERQRYCFIFKITFVINKNESRIFSNFKGNLIQREE